MELQQPIFTPEHRSKGMATISGLGGMFQRKVWTHHLVGNEGDKEPFGKRKTEKKGPLEPTSSGVRKLYSMVATPSEEGTSDEEPGLHHNQ